MLDTFMAVLSFASIAALFGLFFYVILKDIFISCFISAMFMGGGIILIWNQ